MTPISRATAWMTALTVTMLARLSPPDDEDRDRGDVPGWVMITVMTAPVPSTRQRPAAHAHA